MKAFVLVVMGLIIVSGCLDKLMGSEDDVVCNRPYLKVGKECCLDKDGNSICDRDESPTQTTVKPTPTTVAQGEPVCSRDEDCELPEMKIVCDGEDVVKIYGMVECVNPGTASSSCRQNTKTQKLQTCTGDETCYQGVCAPKELLDSLLNQPVTTVQGSQTTTTAASSDATTTTVASSDDTTSTSSGATTSTLTSSDATTTTTASGPTSTTVAQIPCASLKAWSQAQCDIRACGVASTCKYKPNSNPLLPGSCYCKSTLAPIGSTTFAVIATTTLPHITSTTLNLGPVATITFQQVTTTSTTLWTPPCSFGYVTDPVSCSSRSCSAGYACTYKPPSTPGFPGKCQCTAVTTTTMVMLPGSVVLPTTTLIQIPGSIAVTTAPTVTTLMTPMTMIKVPTTLQIPHYP